MVVARQSSARIPAGIWPSPDFGSARTAELCFLAGLNIGERCGAPGDEQRAYLRRTLGHVRRRGRGRGGQRGCLEEDASEQHAGVCNCRPDANATARTNRSRTTACASRDFSLRLCAHSGLHEPAAQLARRAWYGSSPSKRRTLMSSPMRGSGDRAPAQAEQASPFSHCRSSPGDFVSQRDLQRSPAMAACAYAQYAAPLWLPLAVRRAVWAMLPRTGSHMNALEPLSSRARRAAVKVARGPADGLLAEVRRATTRFSPEFGEAFCVAEVRRATTI